MNILEMGISQTSFLGWSGTSILPISVSQVTRIIGMSHKCLVRAGLFLRMSEL
jgi:hypothetical protein